MKTAFSQVGLSYQNESATCISRLIRTKAFFSAKVVYVNCHQVSPNHMNRSTIAPLSVSIQVRPKGLRQEDSEDELRQNASHVISRDQFFVP